MATAKWEHLVCAVGDHKWKRELGKRGRKPTHCPRHKPTPVSAPGVKAEAKELHCVIGNHKWLREPTRGRVPTSCPEHRESLPIAAAPRNENGKVTLHCEIGNHDWERDPKKGRKPSSCPVHSGPKPVAVSVVKGSETGDKPAKKSPEQIKEDQLAKSRERAANLEGALKERGTHISQQSPYILYKKVGEKKGRGKTPPATTWDKVTEHSPLAMAQYVNAHEKDFQDGNYRYERNGKVIVL